MMGLTRRVAKLEQETGRRNSSCLVCCLARAGGHETASPCDGESCGMGLAQVLAQIPREAKCEGN